MRHGLNVAGGRPMDGPFELLGLALNPARQLDVFERAARAPLVRAAPSDPEVAHQPAVSRLNVPQYPLRLSFEGGGQLAQARADHLRLLERFFGGLPRALDVLVGFLASDLGDSHRLRLRFLLR